ncbi:uncharacterized protein ARMOST_09974 [Armillaria ostoyae]|uniref:DUF6534 domain-containing protein n=1 Tax=Armillaria ostoyae TaxID=47428 RepID=A0A284RD08_ARMOS|nr:uncharacterized protein ARMOST_09974 [Armillaria ostoyae]
MDSNSLGGTMGPLYIGMVLAGALWGVSCVQTWYYFDNYKNDPTFLRVVVFCTWLSDTIHQILISQAVYNYTITHFGDTDNLQNVLWSLYLEALFNGITGFLVQSFFVHRIWTFRKNIPITFVISLLVIGEFGVTIAYVALGMNLKTFTDLKQIKGVSMSINALAAAGDVLISAAICTMLNSSKSGFAWSNHVINRLILFSINSGLLTSICAVMSLVTILALPNTLIYFCFYFLIGRFYSNSLLATLNARKGMRAMQSSSRGESHSLQERTQGGRLVGRFNGLMNQGDKTGIQVQIETIRAQDFSGEVSIGILDDPDSSVRSVKGDLP